MEENKIRAGKVLRDIRRRVKLSQTELLDLIFNEKDLPESILDVSDRKWISNLENGSYSSPMPSERVFYYLKCCFARQLTITSDELKEVQEVWRSLYNGILSSEKLLLLGFKMPHIIGAADALVVQSPEEEYLRQLEADILRQIKLNKLIALAGRVSISSFDYKEETDLSTVLDDEHYVVLLGEPGSGKTTLLLQLALEAIADFRNGLTRRLPLFARLEHFQREQNIENFLRSELMSYISEEHPLIKSFQSSLNQAEGWVLLLDGLNELPKRRIIEYGKNLFDTIRSAGLPTAFTYFAKILLG